MLSSVEVVSEIAQQLEPAVSAAAKAGAESGSRGRGGGGTLGNSFSWVVAPFLDLLDPRLGRWSCKDDAVLMAAYCLAGGSTKLTVEDFEGV